MPLCPPQDVKGLTEVVSEGVLGRGPFDRKEVWGPMTCLLSVASIALSSEE